MLAFDTRTHENGDSLALGRAEVETETDASAALRSLRSQSPFPSPFRGFGEAASSGRSGALGDGAADAGGLEVVGVAVFVVFGVGVDLPGVVGAVAEDVARG